MDLEVQINALHYAEQEYNHYARYVNAISEELHQVRRQLTELSGMDYAMLRLRVLEGRLDNSRNLFRKTADTLDYAARKYANVDNDVKNKTPDNIKAIRSFIERFRQRTVIEPICPPLPWQLRQIVWEIVRRRKVPPFVPGWVPLPALTLPWLMKPRSAYAPTLPPLPVIMPYSPLAPYLHRIHVLRLVRAINVPLIAGGGTLIIIHASLQ